MRVNKTSQLVAVMQTMVNNTMIIGSNTVEDEDDIVFLSKRCYQAVELACLIEEHYLGGDLISAFAVDIIAYMAGGQEAADWLQEWFEEHPAYVKLDDAREKDDEATRKEEAAKPDPEKLSVPAPPNPDRTSN